MCKTRSYTSIYVRKTGKLATCLKNTVEMFKIRNS